jgi:tryptophan 7-halogenase
VLYGMGFRPDPAGSSRRPEDPAVAEGFFREAAGLAGRMMPALPSNRSLIAHVQRHGLSRI